MFKILETKYNENFLIIRFLGIKISTRLKILDIIEKQKQELQNIKKNLENIDLLKRLIPNPYLRFSIDIVDHCNLNCKGCDHFCPISDKTFLLIEQYEKDIRQLAKICDSGKLIKLICIEGGEPLLHPDVNKFMEITRKYCPTAKINLMTNAILLPQMNEEFYAACGKYNVTIAITKYPIKIDFEKIHEKAQKYNAEIFYFNDFDKKDKTSWKIPLDIEGKQDASGNFLRCYMANHCITLRDSKLYTCSTRAYAHKFNKYFNQNLILSEYDGISIYDVNSFNDLTKFLASPIPFCRYCNIDGREDLGKFELSQKSMSEWV